MVGSVCAVVAGVAGMKNARDGGCRCLRAFFFNQGRVWGDYGKAGRFGRVFLRFVTDDTFDTFSRRWMACRDGWRGCGDGGSLRCGWDMVVPADAVLPCCPAGEPPGLGIGLQKTGRVTRMAGFLCGLPLGQGAGGMCRGFVCGA